MRMYKRNEFLNLSFTFPGEKVRHAFRHCFDLEDQDWCCEEVFATREDLFIWEQDAHWEKIFKATCDMISKYLDEGKYADELKKYEAVACGFVDGDLEILYKQTPHIPAKQK